MIKKYVSLLAMLFFCCTVSGFAATHYVSPGGSHVPPYTNMITAATDIQSAINVSIAGDTILVNDGTYETGGSVAGGSLTNRVVIDKAITVKSIHGAKVTVIKGAGDTNGIGAVRCVLISADAVLSGFTITNGHTWVVSVYADNKIGGGIRCLTDGVVSNCVITGNSAFSGGGCAGGTLNGCTITGNSVRYSGGGCTSCDLTDCTVTDNTSLTNGGGVAHSDLIDCTLSRNRARYGGGGFSGTMNDCIITENSAVRGGGTYQITLNDCSVVNNRAADIGGGTYIGTASRTLYSENRSDNIAGGAYYGTLKKCIVKNNHSASSGGGVQGSTMNNCMVFANTSVMSGGCDFATLNNCTVFGNSATNFAGGSRYGTHKNSIVWGNAAPSLPNWDHGTFDHSCTSPLPAGTGNISADPLFVSINDLRLRGNSPCINAGDNANAPMPYDLAGTARIIARIVDMGAYEFSGASGVISAVDLLLLLGKK